MKSRFVRFALFGLAAIAATAAFGFLVMILWNWLIPPITGWHAVTYWQALGLLVLSKILFSGFRGAGGNHRWRRRMAAKWEQMTPEQQKIFREAMRTRCGWSPPPATDRQPPDVYQP